MHEKRLKITEIFHSIQGESSLAGERFSFIRLTGCPLRCSWCDTTYSFTGGEWMSIEDIQKKIEPHQTKWVLVTGGEPLAQKTCLDLVKALRDSGKFVSIETSGEKDVSDYVGLAKIIMDIKTPSSDETPKIGFENFDKLQSSDEVKFVIQNKEDYEFSKRIVKEYDLERRFVVLFSPVFEVLSLKDLSEWIIEDQLNVRLQTQLHKWIWGKGVTGV